MRHMWIAVLGEEAIYEADLPACCQRSARGIQDSFECPSCGAMWQAPLPGEPEECAFVERPSHRREDKGAA